jgi:hypothetical protein
MTFGTKLDGLATRSKAGEWTWRIGTDAVRRWGPLRGRCRGTLRGKKEEAFINVSVLSGQVFIAVLPQ